MEESDVESGRPAKRTLARSDRRSPTGPEGLSGFPDRRRDHPVGIFQIRRQQARGARRLRGLPSSRLELELGQAALAEDNVDLAHLCSELLVRLELLEAHE